MDDLEKKADFLREEILSKVKEYHEISTQRGLVAPDPYVKYVWRTWNEDELVALIDSALDQKMTYGTLGKEFEREFAKSVEQRYAVFVNSGSSANLAAVSALTSKTTLGNYDPLKPGDEVITPAATFPTTLDVLLQNNLIPVFVDIDLGTYNMNPEKIEDALSDKTRLIMLPHTLGNPNNMDEIMRISEENDLYVIEDACDALGSKYKGQMVGTFGDMGTFSFYLSHHISTGEGGMIVTGNSRLKRTVESMRDWGRDCWCEPMKSDTCGKRFGWQLGNLPLGYDHKYIFSNIGFNLKPLDLQAAIGIEQLKKLPWIIEKRKDNFKKLTDRLKEFEEDFILPESVSGGDPCWFSIPLTVREKSKFNRENIVSYLTQKGIETRPFFAGNILRQPAFMGMDHRVGGELINTNLAMNKTFFIGCHPLLTEEMMNYTLETFKSYFNRNGS